MQCVQSHTEIKTHVHGMNNPGRNVSYFSEPKQRLSTDAFWHQPAMLTYKKLFVNIVRKNFINIE